MAEFIRQTEKKETIAVSAGKNIGIEQQRPTTRENVKERKENNAQYVTN